MLERFAYPVLANMNVSTIDRAAVQRVLAPVWYDKTETARKLLGFIAKVLDYAKVQGYRTGDNPAAWKGNLEHVLLAAQAIAQVQHHPALVCSTAF